MNERGVPWYMRILPDSSKIETVFTFDTALGFIRIALTILIGIILVNLAVSLVKRFTKRQLDARSGALVIKIARYAGFAIIALNTLEAAKIDVSALLGAAGIAGIALGFAAQTSVSNFISGFFLMSEKTFSEGDILTVDSVTGVVYSIDALSVKLRTFDNKLVRIPNETLIKATVTNITHFPVRRLNIEFTITRTCDLDGVKKLLYEIADDNEYVLKNPEALFSITRIGTNGLDILFGVWIANADFVAANNSMHKKIVEAFAAHAYEFAYPAITVYPNTVSADNAFPAGIRADNFTKLL